MEEYTTVLPYSDLEEAKRIMADFTEDMQEHGIRGLETALHADSASEECIEINILAGLAQGKPQVEIESSIEFARFDQKSIARFQCERGGKAT